jgi:glycosyltransferase involved in cell wall biosynthesis
MSVVFIADIETSIADGIYKKICTQVKALSLIEGECLLINTQDGHIYVSKYVRGEKVSERPLNPLSSKITNRFKLTSTLCGESSEIVNSIKNGKIYIRHMLPSIALIKLLLTAKKNNTIYYEIPTYPYFGEQIKAGRSKILTSGRILYEILMWPFIYYLIDKLVVIISRKKVLRFKKMIEITNGIDAQNIVEKRQSTNQKSFNIIGVGTIYKYHGFERVIKGIKDCNGVLDNNISVQFHIVGESVEINNLKKLTDKENLNKHVIFHGKVYGENLDFLFDKMDIGVACLALFRRNADIDTTLKLVEYLTRGIPCVSSGELSGGLTSEFPIITVTNNSTPIDIENLYYNSKKFTNNDLMRVSAKAKEIFNWEYILRALIKG